MFAPLDVRDAPTVISTSPHAVNLIPPLELSSWRLAPKMWILALGSGGALLTVGLPHLAPELSSPASSVMPSLAVVWMAPTFGNPVLSTVIETARIRTDLPSRKQFT